MSEQVTDIFSLDCECSICLENIIGVSNKVVTDCGHTFHCKCLMKNITFNGFGCPYCRNAMAEYDGNYSDSDDEDGEQDDDDEDDDDDDDDDEDDEEEDDDDDDDDDDEDDNDDDTNIKIPDATYVTLKLKELGFTMEELVKTHLFLEHSNWGRFYREYEESTGILFREMSEIMKQYKELPVSASPEENRPDDPNNYEINNDTVYDILDTNNTKTIVSDILDTMIDVIVGNENTNS
jgi:hypothetical protein